MLSAYDALPAGAPESVVWSARARLKDGLVVAYARDHALSFSKPVSFLPRGDPAPSALDGLLSSLAAALVSGFAVSAARKHLTLDAVECRVAAHLENPLVAAGVVGEDGSPALAKIRATLYVATPDSEEAARAALDAALSRCPVHATLSRACPLELTLTLTL